MLEVGSDRYLEPSPLSIGSVANRQHGNAAFSRLQHILNIIIKNQSIHLTLTFRQLRFCAGSTRNVLTATYSKSDWDGGVPRLITISNHLYLIVKLVTNSLIVEFLENACKILMKVLLQETVFARVATIVTNVVKNLWLTTSIVESKAIVIKYGSTAKVATRKGGTEESGPRRQAKRFPLIVKTALGSRTFV